MSHFSLFDHRYIANKIMISDEMNYKVVPENLQDSLTMLMKNKMGYPGDNIQALY